MGPDRRPARGRQDLGFTSAYVFSAVCPGEGKAAAVIMPICNTIAMNHHLREISSQSRHRGPRPAGPHACPRQRPGGAGSHDSQALAIPDNISLLAFAALQPRAQSGRAHLALSAQPLARQLGLSQSGRHHGCLRDGVEPLRWRPRLGPFAVRGPLGPGFDFRLTLYHHAERLDRQTPKIRKYLVIRIIPSCVNRRTSRVGVVRIGFAWSTRRDGRLDCTPR